MTTYAIGDIQGCAGALERLLEKIAFDPVKDKLWLAGDITNRGPSSLHALQRVINLGDSAITVLGNHDLHLLMVMAGYRKTAAKDTLDDILKHVDRDEYFYWLRHQPFLHHDSDLGFTMVHAGIHPHWDLRTASMLAHELEQVLRGENHREFLHALPGKSPTQWQSELEGITRLRIIASVFTRMRFCHADGSLEYDFKGPPTDAPDGLMPWYQVPGRKIGNEKILFGHWASHGESQVNNIYPLDFGCVWGGRLEAMALETGERYSIDCSSSR